MSRVNPLAAALLHCRQTGGTDLSLRAAAERLEISTMSVQRAQEKAIAALQQPLEAGG
jgi:DNA-directed RNA polymerase specialized sigma subunit